MSNTPRTDDQIGYDGSTMSAIRIEFCRQLERELNAANERIKRLEEEVSDLEGINAAMTMDAAMYEDRGPRIQHLEDIINRAHLAFFSDSSDRKVSIAMHRILDEEVRKEVQ